MADNDLAQAYSILGAGMSSSYRTRRKEEEDYRDDARRDARKEQLIGYLAAPLLKGAGDALASGATDLVGNLVLGENAKSFIETEPGRVAYRNSKLADKKEKDILKQIEQLSTGGQTAEEGARKLYESSFRQQLEDEFGSSSETKLWIDSAVADNREFIVEAADQGVKQLRDTATYLGNSPDVDVLKAREQQSPYWSSSTIGKVTKTLANKVTGGKKDLLGNASRYILTGSKGGDPEQRQIFEDIAGPNFEQGLSEKLKAVREYRPGQVSNILLAYKKDNPEMFAAMTVAAERELENRAETIDYNNAINSLEDNNEVDPEFRVFALDQGNKYKNLNDLTNAYVTKIGGIDEKRAKSLTVMFRNQEGPTVEVLESAIAAERYNMSPQDIERLFNSDTTKSRKKVSEIKAETKSFMEEELTAFYNENFAAAMKQLTPEQRSKISPTVSSQLFGEWMKFTATQNLAVTAEAVSEELFLGIPTTAARPEVKSTSLKDTDLGVRFIFERFSTDEGVEKLKNSARQSGVAQQIQQSSQQLIDPYDKMLDITGIKEMMVTNGIGDSTVSQVDRAEIARDMLSQLLFTIEEEAESKRHVDKDGNPNISPRVMAAFNKLEEDTMRQIYPNGQGGS
jgi:hypothetical protein